MKNVRLLHAFVQSAPRVSVMLLAGSLGMAVTAAAQDANPNGTVKDGYTIRQTVDLGGHIASHSGSGPVYDTMVNLESGPRVLNETLDMRAVDGSKHWLFDTLFTGSAGYGGDPNDFTTFRMSKGKTYDFTGLFRRDRQYFDYDLFANPLIPAGVVSNGYTFPQINHAPHLFNTVRRMTDTDLTLFPLAKFTVRVGYSQNVMEGPTYSSIHLGADSLLYQAWRNSTDTWRGAVDWKPFQHTVLTYEEVLNHYKGDTSWSLPNSLLPLQLSNGTPVNLGFDNVTAPAATSGSSACGAHPAILNAATNPPTANACENGFLQYTRSQPTRTLFPTEEFRFQSSDIKNFQTNGRIAYTDANMHLPNLNEYFNGNESRTTVRAYTVTGNSWAARYNVSADYGFVWTLTEKVAISEQYDFQNWRQPSSNLQSEVDQKGTSMLAAPGLAQPPAITAAGNFLGQKTNRNTIALEVLPSTWASFSVGYRFRDRSLRYVESASTDALATGRNYTYSDQQNSVFVNAVLRPAASLKLNGSVEIGTANNVYVPIGAKNFNNYQLRGTWKPKNWATVSGGYNDEERKDNATNVGYAAHNRSASAGASLAPSEHFSVDLNYAHTDVFSTIRNCFDDSGFVPTDATPMPVGVACGNAVNTATTIAAFYGTSRYDAPTQYGSFGVTYSPVTKLQTGVGYRMSAVDGHTEFLNPRNVPGSLQSQFQTPYANATWTVAKGWGFRGDWNYYGYGEGSPVGPTLPRSFRGNVYTLGMHYEF